MCRACLGCLLVVCCERILPLLQSNDCGHLTIAGGRVVFEEELSRWMSAAAS